LKSKGFFKKLFTKGTDDDEVDLASMDREKQEMIEGIVNLSETTVKEIMVPRIDVSSLSIDAPIKESLAIIYESGHSRLPVYKETIDNIVGVLYVKDLLRYLVKADEEIKLDELIRTPYFVPESKKLNSLLKEFKKRRVHMAIAVDEYGGTSGIVTLEDVIEEIVGNIQDEFDHETEEILEIGERAYLCDARINLEDLNRKLNLNLPDEEFDTLSGFVFNLFGKIPVKFEKASYKNIDFIIQEMEGHKILTVKVLLNIMDNNNHHNKRDGAAEGNG
jgi:CBS domain containing-hemolysin-like protein